jgi:hypothetical protein
MEKNPHSMKSITLPLFALLLASCASPTVNLSTPEPIKVDVAMRLDVYQHSKEAAPSSKKSSPSSDPDSARRNRMADIQTFKDSRLVGEGRDALLSIRTDTPGEYGDYIRKIVSEENSDRMALLKSEADKQKSPLTAIQTKQSDIAGKMAFKGEWIETVNPDGTTKWIQKSE